MDLVRFASQRDSDKDLIPTHLIIYMGVSAMKWGMLVKLDPAFPTELQFLNSFGLVLFMQSL